jgi:hypothetical protein
MQLLLDKLDLFIIKKIYLNKHEITTWQIAKEYIKKNSLLFKERKSNPCNMQNVIKARLQKMSKVGLVIISKKQDDPLSRLEYNLIADNVMIGKHKFPDGTYDTLLLKINGMWGAYQC